MSVKSYWKLILIGVAILVTLSACLDKYTQPWINAYEDGYFYDNQKYIQYYYKNHSDTERLREALIYNRSLEKIAIKYKNSQ